MSASKQKQEDKLKKFASGITRVLVSTSVAEEGLDIATCSLVIKYNYATNEIAHVQRRGRGRALNSTCVLVTNSPALRDQESSNKDKENMMNQALSLIQSNPASFKDLVVAEISNIWARIVREDTERAQQVSDQINSGVTYRIVCKKCDVSLCTSKDIRARNTQYFVCDPAFWNLVRKIDLSLTEQAGNRCHSTGKILCVGRNCGSMLGRLIDLGSAELPCLSADAIVLVNTSSGERIQVKKWKQILMKHFTPTSIRQLDVQRMKDASQPRAPLSFQLESNGLIQDILREL
uniref:Helicase C-terminal domain-containing protein n=1 Tax=Caenorhabditis tropicalis TaxID=1561998 RepID=A0A1I7UNQ3_9PELO